MEWQQINGFYQVAKLGELIQYFKMKSAHYTEAMIVRNPAIKPCAMAFASNGQACRLKRQIAKKLMPEFSSLYQSKAIFHILEIK